MLLTELTLADVGITAGGITTVAIAVQQYFQRLKVAQAKDQTMISGSEAISAQFATLEAAIKSNHLETAKIREEVLRMELVIHNQQRTITRMEMLIRGLVYAMDAQGKPLPPHLQAEINDLIVSKT